MGEGQDIMSSHFKISTLKVELHQILQLNFRRLCTDIQTIECLLYRQTIKGESF